MADSRRSSEEDAGIYVASLFRVSDNGAGGRLWFDFTHGHSRRSTEEDAGILLQVYFVLVTNHSIVRVDGFGLVSHMATQGGALRKTQGFMLQVYFVVVTNHSIIHDMANHSIIHDMAAGMISFRTGT